MAVRRADRVADAVADPARAAVAAAESRRPARRAARAASRWTARAGTAPAPTTAARRWSGSRSPAPARACRRTTSSAPSAGRCRAEAIATVDAGAHMLVAMPLFEVDEPRRCLISSGLATMGFSLPAAIAASLTDRRAGRLPDRRRRPRDVPGRAGDGRAAGRDLRVVVFDDATLTPDRDQAGRGAGRRRGRALRRGRLRGRRAGLGLRAETVADAASLEAALAPPGPSLTTVQIDPSAYAAVLAATRA